MAQVKGPAHAVLLHENLVNANPDEKLARMM